MIRTWHNACILPRRATRRGFTLTELLVVVGLFIVLMLTVSAIFTSTSKAVGTGQAISEGMRDLRGSQAVFENDMARLQRTDTPFLMITNRRESAFANAADAQADQDYNPGLNTTTVGNRAIQERQIRTFLDPNNTTGAETEYSPVLLNARNHRVDLFQFFARGRFARQTGDDGAYRDPTSSNEAFIRYGHLRQPDNSAGPAYYGLGPDYYGAFWAIPPVVPLNTAATNPNNFYASQWILGRDVILLREPEARRADDTAAPAGGLFIYDDRETDPAIPNGLKWTTRQDYYWRPAGAPAASLAPLGAGSVASNTGLGALPAPTPVIEDSRYDLAGTTLRDFRLNVYNNDVAPVAVVPLNMKWWLWFDYRNLTNLFPARPVDSAGMARTVPAFIPHCTQFAVEFAGDFVTEDAYGNVTAGVPDGRTDFYVTDLASGNPVYRTRWYGFPRNTHGTNVVLSYAAGRTNNDLVDVVPLRDVLQACVDPTTYTPTPQPPAAFERNVNTTIPLPPSGDYAGFTAGIPDTAPVAQYICAWGPNEENLMPQMIRFVLTVEDPAGRVPDGQSVEYVFRLQ